MFPHCSTGANGAPQSDIQVDQLVLLVDELKTRDQWSVGRVVEVGGDDHHVHQARVILPNGRSYVRDRTKLVPLELDE